MSSLLKEQLKIPREQCYSHRLGCWNSVLCSYLVIETGLVSAGVLQRKVCLQNSFSRAHSLSLPTTHDY